MAAAWISKSDAIALVAAAQGPDVISRACTRSTLAAWVRRGAVRTKAGERPAWAKRPRQLYRRADIVAAIKTTRIGRVRDASPEASGDGPRSWRRPVGDPRLEPPTSPLG